MNDVGEHINSIGHLIQLAVAPVFLLSGVGITLTVFTNRLARIVDRARKLEEVAKTVNVTELPVHQGQLRVLERRAWFINRAITLSTICALLVSFVVVLLFLSSFISIDLSWPVAALFIVAMLSFIGALLLFLREVFLSIGSLTIGVRR